MTESSRARRASTASPRAWRRSSDATVWRLFFTRWWISWASTPRITARPCSRATAAWCAIDASSARSSSVNGVSRSATSSPITRRFQRSGVRTACFARAALRPGDLAVLEDERRPRRRDRVHRRLDDRLQRLLEVEGLRHRLGDPRQRLQLLDPALRVGVELRVLDRLRDLGRDRQQEVDLGLRELALLARADVQRPLQLLAREDRHGEDRLVLLLVQVLEPLEARIEMRLRRDHHRRPIGSRSAGDPLTGPHLRPPRHLLDARPVRRPQHELVRPLVVEVDEARVRRERLRHLARDELEHLLEVERRVDGGDRLRQQAEMPLGGFHAADCRPGPLEA